MSGADYDALLRRRRIWGVPPDVVAHLAAEYQREQAELRAHSKELEGRLARANTERDEANQAADALRARVARLEQENEEIANRPETVREEAVRFVVDAWAEAQALREQTRREIEEAETKAREEVAAIRRDFMEERRRYETAMANERQRYEAEMTEERQRSEAEIAVLRERRQKAIRDLESLAESLLGQAARGIAPRPAPGAPHDTPIPISSGGAQEDQMLAKALDDLEAILNASRKSGGE
jgi:DNA repair exonuclease SbcCD ATPase subunit